MIRNGERARAIASDRRLLVLAVEPSGVGPYVEAVEELIEQAAARPSAVRVAAVLRLVR
jgi:hypothetical protein